MEFLDVPGAVAFTLQKCAELDYPQSIAPSEVYRVGTPAREALISDVKSRLRNGDFGRSATIFRIPKSKVATRVITVPGLVDQVIFEALVSSLEGHAKLLLHPDTHSLRSHRAKGSVAHWVAFQDSQRETCASYNWVGTWDLADYFETIPHTRLGERLFEEFVSVGASRERVLQTRDTLLRLIGTWCPGGQGIPQGPPGSFFLADIFLLSSDRAIRAEGYRMLRWCDDHTFFGATEREIILAYRRMEQLNREAGVFANRSKAKPQRAVAFLEELAKDAAIYQEVSSVPGRRRLETVLRLLEGDDLSRHARRYLLNRAYEIVYHCGVTRPQSNSIAERALTDLCKQPQYLVRYWWRILARLSADPVIKELTGAVIESDLLVDHTSQALVYDVYLHASADSTQITADQWSKIESSAHDDTLCPSRRGKALLLSARNGRGGWQDLIPVNTPQEPELRLYQAMAIQGLESKKRKEYSEELARHSGCNTERKFGEFFKFHKNGLWTTPLTRPGQPAGYW